MSFDPLHYFTFPPWHEVWRRSDIPSCLASKYPASERGGVELWGLGIWKGPAKARVLLINLGFKQRRWWW